MIVAAAALSLLPVHVAITTWNDRLTEKITEAAHTEFTLSRLDSEFSPGTTEGRIVVEIVASENSVELYRPTRAIIRLDGADAGVEPVSAIVINIDSYVILKRSRSYLSKRTFSVFSHPAAVDRAVVEVVRKQIGYSIDKIHKRIGTPSS